MLDYVREFSAGDTMRLCDAKGGVERMATTRDENENGDEKAQRISITIDPSIRRIIRIAAAWADMDVGEWSAKVLENAAKKAVPEAMRRKPRTADL